jgi:hypothetical protein
LAKARNESPEFFERPWPEQPEAEAKWNKGRSIDTGYQWKLELGRAVYQAASASGH